MLLGFGKMCSIEPIRKYVLLLGFGKMCSIEPIRKYVLLLGFGKMRSRAHVEKRIVMVKGKMCSIAHEENKYWYWSKSRCVLEPPGKYVVV